MIGPVVTVNERAVPKFSLADTALTMASDHQNDSASD
jgi:hypothetical protein